MQKNQEINGVEEIGLVTPTTELNIRHALGWPNAMR